MITRFAPSPTGPLHLGHFYSAMTAYRLAQSAGGQFLLRIEDIDFQRSRLEYENAIMDDLAWAGLRWPAPVMRQSNRNSAYKAALVRLGNIGLLYACTCTRADIKAAMSAHQEGVIKTGIYPGTCRHKKLDLHGHTLRLNMRRALEYIDNKNLIYKECGQGRDINVHIQAQDLLENFGDIVLARRDIGTSYHLAVTVDDAAQKITHIVRGADLEEETAIHCLLQTLLDLPTPIYYHHALIRDDTGKRLAKRDDARAISLYRNAGYTPLDLWAHVRQSHDSDWAT